jgi:hypothetical protein
MRSPEPLRIGKVALRPEHSVSCADLSNLGTLNASLLPAPSMRAQRSYWDY